MKRYSANRNQASETSRIRSVGEEELKKIVSALESTSE